MFQRVCVCVRACVCVCVCGGTRTGGPGSGVWHALKAVFPGPSHRGQLILLEESPDDQRKHRVLPDSTVSAFKLQQWLTCFAVSIPSRHKTPVCQSQPEALAWTMLGGHRKLRNTPSGTGVPGLSVCVCVLEKDNVCVCA